MKLKIAKQKLIPLILAGAMSISLTGCNGNVDMNDTTFKDLLEISDVKDDTLLDEMIESGDFMFDEGVSYLDAADELEKCIEINEMLKKVDFSEVEELKPITDKEFKKYSDLDIEDIETLVDTMNDDRKNSFVDMEKRVEIYKALNRLNDNSYEFISKYGYHICERLMLTSIKAGVADELDLNPEEVDSITLPPYYYGGDGPEDLLIEYGTSYKIPVSAGEIWNTANYAYTWQGAEKLKDNKYHDDLVESCKKALNYSKTTIAAGVNINKKKIKAAHSAHYIKENYLKK